MAKKGVLAEKAAELGAAVGALFTGTPVAEQPVKKKARKVKKAKKSASKAAKKAKKAPKKAKKAKKAKKKARR
jgi:hypothetical protein